MLSDRRKRVLSALIQEYIEYALPVASRTLAERYALGVSSATVRNDLSALEDAGYIRQPHTSAGRIPTDIGYRAYVDQIIDDLDADLGPNQESLIRTLREQAGELDDLIDRTSEALARLTNCLSIVVAPSFAGSCIRQISLISLSPYRAILVVVLEDGDVLNRTLTFTDEVTTERLKRVEETVNLLASGKSVAEARTGLLTHAKTVFDDPLFMEVIDELGVCMTESNTVRSHKMGLPGLLKKPEFSNAQALMPIMEVLEDDTVLMHMFDRDPFDGESCTVRIGSENVPELSGVSVVSAPYGHSDCPGIIAVIGPTRMDYRNVIDAVRAAQKTLRDR